MHAPPARKPGLRRWTGVLGIVLSGLLLWWTLHDVDLGEVVARITDAHAGWLVLMIVAATATFPLRTIRWWYLLRIEGAPLRLGPLWHATAIGFMVNNLVPARAGEFARAYVIRRTQDVRFSTAFASIAVERILDGITMAALLVIAAFAGGFDTTTTIGGVSIGRLATLTGVLFGALLLGGLLAVRFPTSFLGAARAVMRPLLPERWTDRLAGVMEGLLAGLDALASPGRAAAAAFWSLVVWGTACLSFYLGFRAFGLDVPWSAALMTQALISFGVAVPSAPGFFGVFEGVARATLAFYGVAAGAAVSLAVGYHLLTFLPITLLGLWSLGAAGLRMGELGGGQGDERRAMKGDQGR